MNNIIVEVQEEFGWKITRKDNCELYISGILHNIKTATLFESLQNISQDDIIKFINDLDGHFSLIFKKDDFLIACVDKVRSIPLFYTSYENDILINSNAKNLAESINLSFDDIDKEQLLCFNMSGYTLFDKTLYHGLFSLKAGELLIVKDNICTKEVYNRYEPWNVIDKNYTTYIEELRDTTIDLFKKVINTLNGRQVVVPLSAGNDSRLVASCLKHLGYNNVLCYSYGTEGNFESKIARVIAKKLDYKFIFIPMTHAQEQSYYSSKEFKSFLDYADTKSSIQFIQSISTVKYLKNNNLIEKDAVFINGNSGDFISGGHILGKVKEDNTSLDMEERLDIILEQIIKKHFSMWGCLTTDANKSKLKELHLKEIEKEDILTKVGEFDHGLYEYIEFINRQSKYVISGQRVYEFYGYQWILPLWDDDYLKFWEKVPKEFKLDQILYKEMLKESNFGDVWTNEIPVNKYDIVPKWIIPIRFIFKVLFAFGGSKGKKLWHSFEISFFQYWMDVIHLSDAVGYKSMIRAFFKKPRNSISILIENYIDKNK